MIILTLRTDKPEAEIGLFQDTQKIAYETWYAHRELSVTLHQKIRNLLSEQHKDLQDLDGLICFAGPGSFTGLRIGLTVGNTLAYSLGRPIVATTGDNWISDGYKRLQTGDILPLALPHYGAPVNITVQKK